MLPTKACYDLCVSSKRQERVTVPFVSRASSLDEVSGRCRVLRGAVFAELAETPKGKQIHSDLLSSMKSPRAALHVVPHLMKKAPVAFLFQAMNVQHSRNWMRGARLDDLAKVCHYGISSMHPAMGGLNIRDDALRSWVSPRTQVIVACPQSVIEVKSGEDVCTCRQGLAYSVNGECQNNLCTLAINPTSRTRQNAFRIDAFGQADMRLAHCIA
mmetsp:Transcript_106915/g.312612  ORF Transcript_106915/g.312612 Transcript_106915/m.312612 type:complete len:214 (-) Transcript_106915:1559-2200(-)